jgi:hypothetical protein
MFGYNLALSIHLSNSISAKLTHKRHNLLATNELIPNKKGGTFSGVAPQKNQNRDE